MRKHIFSLIWQGIRSGPWQSQALEGYSFVLWSTWSNSWCQEASPYCGGWSLLSSASLPSPILFPTALCVYPTPWRATSETQTGRKPFLVCFFCWCRYLSWPGRSSWRTWCQAARWQERKESWALGIWWALLYRDSLLWEVWYGGRSWCGRLWR